jgi:hypothetical protein
MVEAALRLGSSLFSRAAPPIVCLLRAAQSKANAAARLIAP